MRNGGHVILTEQRALRSLQHLDALEVDRGDLRHDGVRERRLVQIDSDGRRGAKAGVVQADASDHIDRLSESGRGEVEAEHHLAEIGQPAQLGCRLADLDQSRLGLH